jgi:hypothetical protein
MSCYGNVIAAGIHHQQGDEINVLKAASLLTCHSTGTISFVICTDDARQQHDTFTALCLVITGEVMVPHIL